MATIRRKLEPGASVPPAGTIMYCGIDHASATEYEEVPQALFGSGCHGKLVRMLRGRVCEIETTRGE